MDKAEKDARDAEDAWEGALVDILNGKRERGTAHEVFASVLRAKDEEIARLADGGARWAQNAEHFRKEAARLREALEDIRDCSPDNATRHIARQALMSIKQEKSDTLAGPVDAGDTSASCSETAGTKPTCALTAFQVRRLEDVARVAEETHYILGTMPAELSPGRRWKTYQELKHALAALRDSGWKG